MTVYQAVRQYAKTNVSTLLYVASSRVDSETWYSLT